MASDTNAPYFPDPFRHGGSFSSTSWSAILATALFRCWHIIIFFGVWSTVISVISSTIKDLSIASTLLATMVYIMSRSIGTVLGTVIIIRTTSSFKRYNEGRKYWSQIVYATRTFARLIWFHVPDSMDMGNDVPEEERRARVLVEKKTVLNLVDAFCVAVKHYLHSESDIHYEDLHHGTEYLPTYVLSLGLPSTDGLASDAPTSPKSVSFQKHQPQAVVQRRTSNDRRPRTFSVSRDQHEPRERTVSGPAPHLPLPATTPGEIGTYPSSVTLAETEFLPAPDSPEYSYFDLFPFPLMVKFLTERVGQLRGGKAALLREKPHQDSTTQNLPLEISLYISSYIAVLQNRKTTHNSTISNLITAVNQLVDASTGLERILTTPIPYSYSIHLWTIIVVYCLILPFQLWSTLGYLTIPGTVFASYFLFGFMLAGEEIEIDPFGYNKNDMDLDHFTDEIICKELAAISATPRPDPKDWIFSPFNDRLVNPHDHGNVGNVTPEEWVNRGMGHLQAALSGL